MEHLQETLYEIMEAGSLTLNCGLGLLVYILQALAIYTIAKRREIAKPWLAWIPLMNVWTLGAISDQYRYVVKRQVKNKRKVLLGLNIALTVLGTVMLAVLMWFLIDVLAMVFASVHSSQLTEQMAFSMLQNYLPSLVVIALLSIPVTVVGVIYTVIFYMALYDVFRSSDPDNSAMYLVLSLVGNVVIEGAYCIFTILCKDKDLGMPPRKRPVQEQGAVPETETVKE